MTYYYNNNNNYYYIYKRNCLFTYFHLLTPLVIAVRVTAGLADLRFFLWNLNAPLLMTLHEEGKHGVRTAMGVGGDGTSFL